MKSQLCLACGLCCDGNLFAFVALSSPEAQALRGEGLAVIDDRGRLKLAQRCSALEGCRCRVYDQRPFGCRKFDCLLARSLVEKDLPLSDALAIVDEAKARLARLEGLLPKAQPSTSRVRCGGPRRSASRARVSPMRRGRRGTRRRTSSGGTSSPTEASAMSSAMRKLVPGFWR